MISNLGYSDSKTAFGMQFVPNKHLQTLTKGLKISPQNTIERVAMLAEEFSKVKKGQTLEIVDLQDSVAIVYNHTTGNSKAIPHVDSNENFLVKILKDLINDGKIGTPFFDEKTKVAKICRMLTGQKSNDVIII